MAAPLKILTVVGARPQFVKAAALSRVIAARPDTDEVMVHTGQHFDANMSDVFFSELGIAPPRYSLGLGGSLHGAMTGRMLERVEEVLLAETPDWVLIYGDTNSTLAGALAAAKLHIPVAHVEAGLRSFNRRMPEEINRVVADHVSTLLLCPTQTAVENLRTEGITEGVHHIGDVMYDATLDAKARARERSSVLAALGVEEGRYILATVHRAENTDDPVRLRRVLDFLKAAACDMPVVLPLHPRTADAVKKAGLDLDGLTVCDPVGHIDMTRLLDGSVQVLTDSGGVQKEAYFHRKPCVTLRDETEWVETIEAGWNRLWRGDSYCTPRHDIPDYGDGHAAELIVDRILRDDASRGTAGA